MTADFLIIGGGIAGISAAARLSHHGSVTLLEAESTLAHHASGRSAALYEPRYGLAPVVELSLASGDHFRAIPNLLSPRGLMILGKAGEDAAFEHDIADMELPEIGVDAARAIVPILNPDVVTRAAKADQKDYAEAVAFGKKLLAQIDANWAKVEADNREALRVSQLKDARIKELTAEVERMAAEAMGSIADLQGNILRARRAISEMKLRAIQRTQEYRKEVDTQLSDVRREVQSGQDKLKAMGEELARTQVKAPVDGQVVGTLGVIGPTRMPYDRMIQIVNITSRLVSNALSQSK